MTIVGIIPAAGYATRLGLASGSKEMLAIGGKPVVDFLVERMRLGGCREIRLVTRPDKTDLIEHGRRSGLTVRLARPRTVSESFACGLADLAPDDVVLLGFPDTLWAPQNGFAMLVDALVPTVDVVLGLFRSPDLQRSDVVEVDPAWRVTAIDVKPARPRSPWLWGFAAARVQALAGLEAVPEPGRHLDALARAGRPLIGVPLAGPWLDVGTKEALSRAEELVRDFAAS